MYEPTFPIVYLVLSFILAIFPALIASFSGRKFGLWYMYGLFLFPIAFFHSIFVLFYDTFNNPVPKVVQVVSETKETTGDTYTELQKLKGLLDNNIITEEEYNNKRDILVKKL